MPTLVSQSEKCRKSPIAASAQVAEQGEKAAKTTRASGHGTRGRDDGAAAAALNPGPADRTSRRVQDESDGRAGPLGARPAPSAPSRADREVGRSH